MKLNKIPFRVENIRIETSSAGYATIWFDLAGERFAEPEAMTNLLVDFDDLMLDMKQHTPQLYAQSKANTTDASDLRHGSILERLDAQATNWPNLLRGYVERQLDLEQIENERLGWLHERRQRKADAHWEGLAQKASSDDPSWDEVANRLIDAINSVAVQSYPELLHADAEANNRLREILESHTWRLANELVGFIQETRKTEKK